MYIELSLPSAHWLRAVRTRTYTQHNDVAFYESLLRNCLNVLSFQVV